MPELLSVTRVQLEWADIDSRITHPVRDTQLRAGGVHVSGIVKKIALSTGVLRKGQERDEEFPLRMALGMAFENWVVGLYPEMVWQPGEQSLDGISGNPDGYSLIEIGGQMVPVLEEFKLTWKKRKDNILDEWMWLTQMGAYSQMLAANHARLHVCYVNDRYAPSEPTYYRYMIQWTDSELDSLWEMLVNNKAGVKHEGN